MKLEKYIKNKKSLNEVINVSVWENYRGNKKGK